MSVDLETQIIEASIEPKTYVTTPPWIGSVAFVAGQVRQAGMSVGYHPLEDNPFHGEIWGPFPKPAAVASLAEWYVRIEGVAITA